MNNLVAAIALLLGRHAAWPAPRLPQAQYDRRRPPPPMILPPPPPPPKMRYRRRSRRSGERSDITDRQPRADRRAARSTERDVADCTAEGAATGPWSERTRGVFARVCTQQADGDAAGHCHRKRNYRKACVQLFQRALARAKLPRLELIERRFDRVAARVQVVGVRLDIQQAGHHLALRRMSLQEVLRRHAIVSGRSRCSACAARMREPSCCCTVTTLPGS